MNKRYRGMTCILDVQKPIYEELTFLESIANQREVMAVVGGMRHA